jgi:hypothetical protein
MLISGGTLVSDCHGAIIYMEGEKYICGHCLKPCNSAGTLSQKHERERAIREQHQRLQLAVVEAAKARRKAKLADLNGAGDYIQLLHATMIAEHEAVDALIAFEAENQIGGSNEHVD